MGSCWRTQCRPFHGHLAIEANWKGEKLNKWVPHEQTTNKKKVTVLKCCLLLFYVTTMNYFSIGLWHVMKSGFYATTSKAQLSGWTEKKHQNNSQSQTCTKKRSQSLFGGLLPIQSTTVFWILVKPLHLRSIFSKSVSWTKNGNACSQYWSTDRVQFFSMTTPNHTLQNQHFKSWMNWATKFCLIHHIHLTSCQLTSTSSSILTTFCRENASTTNRRKKMLSRSLLNPEA